MAMPRPKGKALKIAEKVVPGLLAKEKKTTPQAVKKQKGELSKVEILQTNNIENKEGLDEKKEI